MEVSKVHLMEMISHICDAIEEKKAILCELDRGIGDGDHGISMSLGCQAVKEKLPELTQSPISEILIQCGMTFLGAVGASVGPLYGTAAIRAGQAVRGKDHLIPEDIVMMVEAGLKGIQERGKAAVGDKTMVDTLFPAVEALRNEFDRTGSLLLALEKAVKAGRQGMESTIPLRSRLGRSSRLGDRSIGQQDPGATSSFIMLETAYFYLST